jgi:hypothetical protein
MPVHNGIGTLILLHIANTLVRLRVSEEDERQGLRLVLRGEWIF